MLRDTEGADAISPSPDARRRTPCFSRLPGVPVYVRFSA
jgi:hypothetical protein